MSLRDRRRRPGVAALFLLATCGALHTPARAHDDEAAAAARLPQRVALLARAQAELERGDASAALDDFERAAMMLHAADAELGLIRAAMQDGQYRRALAFCAHTAGEHTDDADGAALYAWLLRVGGQGEHATRTLAQARGLAPADAVARAVDQAFATPDPVATGVLLQPLHRMAPWPVALDGAAPAADARFAGSAVLVDDGDVALVPASALAGALGTPPPARLWVRNGLGQSTAATVDASAATPGLVRLVLRRRLPTGASQVGTGRAPFAGTPAYAMQFGAGDGPAWPALTPGFLGGPVGNTEVRKLGFAAAPGAAVLDAGGRLVGIALAPLGGQSTWTPLPATPSSPSDAAAPARGGLVAPDAIYEAGLRRTLQVLVVAPPG